MVTTHGLLRAEPRHLLSFADPYRSPSCPKPEAATHRTAAPDEARVHVEFAAMTASKAAKLQDLKPQAAVTLASVPMVTAGRGVSEDSLHVASQSLS